jgi:cytochrome c oxidase subunit IV
MKEEEKLIDAVFMGFAVEKYDFVYAFVDPSCISELALVCLPYLLRTKELNSYVSL